MTAQAAPSARSAPAPTTVAEMAAWLLEAIKGRPPYSLADVPWGQLPAIWSDARRIRDRYLGELTTAGWTQEQVFGAHPERPWSRLDCQGLAWGLGDRRILSIGPDEIVIESPAGATLRFRKPVAR